MPNSPRLQWPYPAEKQDPWFDAFVSFVEAQDATAYAAREDRNMVLMGGGTMAFNSTTGVLSWSATLQLLSATMGFLWNLGAGSATLADGDLLYVDVTRAPTANVALTATVAAKLPLTDDAVLIAIRRGTRLYFRNGRVLNNGDSKDLFA